MELKVTIVCKNISINIAKGYFKKNTALSKLQATDAVKARKRGVKKLLLFIEWSIAWLVRIKLLDKRRQWFLEKREDCLNVG